MEELVASPLLVPAALTLVTLVVFVFMLTLQKKRSVKGKRERKALGVPVEGAGSAFVEDEDGQVVRRSTRTRKPPANFEVEGTPGKTPAKNAALVVEGTPIAVKTPAPAVTPKSVRTTRSTATAAQAEDLPSPRRVGRPRRTPRA